VRACTNLLSAVSLVNKKKGNSKMKAMRSTLSTCAILAFFIIFGLAGCTDSDHHQPSEVFAELQPDQAYNLLQDIPPQQPEIAYSPAMEASNAEQYLVDHASFKPSESYPSAYQCRVPQRPVSQYPAPPKFNPIPVEQDITLHSKVIHFLKDFYSIYSFGEIFSPDAPYTCRHSWEVLNERPLVLFKWYYRSGDQPWFYNREGQSFEDAVFLQGRNIIAEDFRLFDINNDGM